MSTAKQNDHYVAPYDEGVSFDELPDSCLLYTSDAADE